MSQIDLFLPNIAISAISCAIISITIAFIVAIVLQSIYELGLRKHLNKEWLDTIIYSKDQWPDTDYNHREYRFDSHVERLCREYQVNSEGIFNILVESLRRRGSHSVLSLPPTQLAGQISMMLDAILMNVLAERTHRHIGELNKEDDRFDYIYQTIRTSFEPWLDSIQIELSSRWQKIDLALSSIFAFVMAFIFVLGSGASWKSIIFFIIVLMPSLFVAKYYDEYAYILFSIIFAVLIILFFLSGGLSWITVSFIIPVLMVSQARVLVERVLRTR
jgi:hypothetical protein